MTRRSIQNYSTPAWIANIQVGKLYTGLYLFKYSNMGVVLKHQDKDIYVKSVSWVDGKVEFTKKPNEAKQYSNDWFATAERAQLQHYASLTYEEGGLAEDYTDTIPHLAVCFT